MKKLLLSFVLLFSCYTNSFSLSAEKCGDMINLGIVIIPYVVALITFQQRQHAIHAGVTEKEAEKKYPYKMVGFGKYGISMIVYLTSMFLTQKCLWSAGSFMIKKIVPQGTVFSYVAYSGLGAMVGTTSMFSGILCSNLLLPFLK